MIVEQKLVIGVFESAIEVNDAVDLLQEAGFAAGDVTAVLPQARPTSTKDQRAAAAQELGRGPPEALTTGMTTGVMLGGALGWLVGIGSFVVPGIGPIIASGPLLAALAGAGLGGAVGGLTAALIGIGVSTSDAAYVEAHLKGGRSFLTVRCQTPKDLADARDVFVACGGQEISGRDRVEDIALAGETVDGIERPLSRPFGDQAKKDFDVRS